VGEVDERERRKYTREQSNEESKLTKENKEGDLN
jgi:hypothetical protein